MHRTGIIFAVCLAGFQAGLQDQPAAEAPIKISDYREVKSHRVSSLQPIRVTDKRGLFDAIELEIIVDASGHVIAVEATQGPSQFRSDAVTQAKAWAYRPFMRGGKAVTATFKEYVRLLPPEKLPAVRVPFPEIRDWNSLRMELRRSACYGSCPVYSVEITGDGFVTFIGTSHVQVPGRHDSHISHEAVLQILEAFRKADYFSLDDEYRYPVTDNPTYITSISFDGHSKSVRDYVGEEAGMPHAVEELESAIDRIAGTEKWVRGNPDSVSSLEAEHSNRSGR